MFKARLEESAAHVGSRPGTGKGGSEVWGCWEWEAAWASLATLRGEPSVLMSAQGIRSQSLSLELVCKSEVLSQVPRFGSGWDH